MKLYIAKRNKLKLKLKLPANEPVKQSNAYVNSEEPVKEPKEVHRWNN